MNLLSLSPLPYLTECCLCLNLWKTQCTLSYYTLNTHLSYCTLHTTHCTLSLNVSGEPSKVNAIIVNDIIIEQNHPFERWVLPRYGLRSCATECVYKHTGQTHWSLFAFIATLLEQHEWITLIVMNEVSGVSLVLVLVLVLFLVLFSVLDDRWTGWNRCC